MNIDPKWRFIIGIVVTFAIGVSQGAVQLTHAIPAGWIEPSVAWCGIIAFVGSAGQTAISGLGMTNQSRLAAVQPVPIEQKIESFAHNPEVKQIVTTQTLADATTSEKVVGPPTGAGTK